MSLKDNWKDAGKGIGKSFAGLGKTIVKSVKVGVDNADEDSVPQEEKQDLKKSWSEVGHSFGSAGKSLGKAAAGTAKKVVDKIDEAAEDEPKTGASAANDAEKPE